MKYTVPYLLIGAALIVSTSAAKSDSETVKSNNATNKNITAQPDSNFCFADTVVTEIAPYAISMSAIRRDVVYNFNDGSQTMRCGGTRAWRNNNPGCLRYSQFSRENGAIGQAGGFAVFPDEETGMSALKALLKSDEYINLTIAQVITKYAPPHENPTEKYKNKIKKMTGLPINTRLREMNADQMQALVCAIRIIEGWVPGKENIVKAAEPKRDLAIRQDTIYRALQNQNQRQI